MWCEDTTRVLGEMRAETWDEHDPSLEPGWTDRANRAAFDRSRTMDLETAREACRMQRTRMIEAYGTLEAPTPEADEWFDETGPGHYAEHLPGLEAWVARLRSAA